MISYKTYKLINESLGGPMALGLAPVRSIGLGGSRLAEMGLRPDEIKGKKMGPEVNVDGSEMDDEEMGIEDAPFPPDDDMGDMEDDDMGDMEDDDMGDMEDDDMGDDMGGPANELGHLPFNSKQMGDMHSLAGLDDDPMGDDMGDMGDDMGDMGDDMGDMGDDMGDMEDDDMGDMEDEDMEDEDMEDEDDMGDDMHPVFGKRFGKMESKKHMCGDCSDDDEHQKEDRKMKYMKKDDDSEDCEEDELSAKYGKKSDKEENDEYIGRRGHKEVKESFWNDFMKNAAGGVRKFSFQEDAVIPPSNPNVGLGDATAGNVGHAPQGRVGGVGSNDGEVKTDFFGYQSVSDLPSFYDFVESKKNA